MDVHKESITIALLQATANNPTRLRAPTNTQNADPSQSGTAVFQFVNIPPGLCSHSQM